MRAEASSENYLEKTTHTFTQNKREYERETVDWDLRRLALANCCICVREQAPRKKALLAESKSQGARARAQCALHALLMKFNGGERAAIKALARQRGAFIVKLQIKIETSTDRDG